MLPTVASAFNKFIWLASFRAEGLSRPVGAVGAASAKSACVIIFR